MRASASDLDVLQPVGQGWGCGQGEVVSGRHPGLQALQLSGSSVRGHMTHQVALELVWQEVEVDRHRVAHGHVPEDEENTHALSLERVCNKKWRNASFLSTLSSYSSATTKLGFSKKKDIQQVK